MKKTIILFAFAFTAISVFSAQTAVVKSIDNYPFMDKSLYFSRSNNK